MKDYPFNQLQAARQATSFDDFISDFDPDGDLDSDQFHTIRQLWTALRLGGLDPRVVTVRYIDRHPFLTTQVEED